MSSFRAIGDKLAPSFPSERLTTLSMPLSFLVIYGNMSSASVSLSPCETASINHTWYSLTVRAIGEGKIAPITLPDESILIDIPLQHTTADEHTSILSTCTTTGDTDFEHLIDFVYPDLLTADRALFADRGILSIAPTNVSIDQIDNHVLNLLPNRLHAHLSSNHLIKDNPSDMAEATSTEYLEAVDVPGVPPHELHLKTGCVRHVYS